MKTSKTDVRFAIDVFLDQALQHWWKKHVAHKAQMGGGYAEK